MTVKSPRQLTRKKKAAVGYWQLSLTRTEEEHVLYIGGLTGRS
jgi:hypothetical protein